MRSAAIPPGGESPQDLPSKLVHGHVTGVEHHRRHAANGHQLRPLESHPVDQAVCGRQSIAPARKHRMGPPRLPKAANQHLLVGVEVQHDERAGAAGHALDGGAGRLEECADAHVHAQR